MNKRVRKLIDRKILHSIIGMESGNVGRWQTTSYQDYSLLREKYKLGNKVRPRRPSTRRRYTSVAQCVLSYRLALCRSTRNVEKSLEGHLAPPRRSQTLRPWGRGLSLSWEKDVRRHSSRNHRTIPLEKFFLHAWLNAVSPPPFRNYTRPIRLTHYTPVYIHIYMYIHTRSHNRDCLMVGEHSSKYRVPTFLIAVEEIFFLLFFFENIQLKKISSREGKYRIRISVQQQSSVVRMHATNERVGAFTVSNSVGLVTRGVAIFNHLWIIVYMARVPWELPIRATVTVSQTVGRNCKIRACRRDAAA